MEDAKDVNNDKFGAESVQHAGDGHGKETNRRVGRDGAAETWSSVRFRDCMFCGLSGT